MADIFKKYGYTPDKEAITRALDIIAGNLESMKNPQILKTCFSMMDLTTLNSQDTPESVARLVEKVNVLSREYPDYPLPASVCVYPNFAGVVASKRNTPLLHATTVAGCFPTSQSYIEVKVAECVRAVAEGADEIDIVLPLNSFMLEDYATAASEISAMRKAIDDAGEKVGRKIVLKVILETGLLVTPERIANASFLAMEEGADFIKTSTGKVSVNATPMAAYVMCQCIKAFNERTGRKVGFKAAGGISTAMDALCYYSIVSSVLGKEWLNKDLFRFGVSRLANNLMSAIEQKTVSVF